MEDQYKQFDEGHIALLDLLMVRPLPPSLGPLPTIQFVTGDKNTQAVRRVLTHQPRAAKLSFI